MESARAAGRFRAAGSGSGGRPSDLTPHYTSLDRWPTPVDNSAADPNRFVSAGAAVWSAAICPDTQWGTDSSADTSA